MAKCISCKARKGKRSCPSLGVSICPSCCGTMRQREIQCPDDCHHLGKSREYHAAREEEGRLNDFEREMSSIVGNEEPHEAILNEIEHAIKGTWNDRPAITDRHVEKALELVLESGKEQMKIPACIPTDLPLESEILIDAIRAVAESDSLGPRGIDPMTWLKCIHRIHRSVKAHYHPADERAYLRFIAHFLY